MGTASVHKSWRKACGAIKDSATVGLAKVNGGNGRDRKDLDVAVVKATAHVERPPKERHLAGKIKDSRSLYQRRQAQAPLAIIDLHCSVVPTNCWLSLQRSSPPRPPPVRSPTCPTASTRSLGASPRPTTGWYVILPPLP
jgi:hypothetical protein